MVDIESYLAQQRRQLQRQQRRIKDFRVFDFNYIPERPLMRPELRRVIDAMLRYEQTGIPNHVIIFGARGSGKTLSMRHLQRVLRDSSALQLLYANCRRHNTSFKLMAFFLGLPARGISLDELYRRFTQHWPHRTVIILDEVDFISDKDRTKDILYFLSREQNNYMAVLLSSSPRFLSELDESTRSSLQPEVIHFKSYSAEQLLRILEQRAQLGLRRYSRRQLQQISALTVRNTNSDVRVAIKTLYYCTVEPGRGVQYNFERARRDIFIDLLADLNDKNLLILKAVQAARDGYVKEVYQHYRRLSRRYREEPFSYVYFYSSLGYMQSLGLLVLATAKLGRTYTNRAQLTFNPELLDCMFNRRF